MEKELREFVLRAYGVEMTDLEARLLLRVCEVVTTRKERELVMGSSNGEPVGLLERCGA